VCLNTGNTGTRRIYINQIKYNICATRRLCEILNPTESATKRPKQQKATGPLSHLSRVGDMRASDAQLHTTLHTNKSRKTVRITLPPSPPPEFEMDSPDQDTQTSHPRRSQRINDSSSQTSSRIVLPTDAVKKADRLRSGSKWRQRDLALLRVKFEPTEESEFSMLDVEHEWSPSQHQSILSLP
jgi:hypothetical protein